MRRLTRIILFLSYIFTPQIHGQIFFDFSGKLQTNSVYSITQDSLGFLWISYGNGIAKFDGYSVSPVNFNDQSVHIGFVNFLQCDKHTNIFIGSNEGAFIYNYANRQIKILNPGLNGQNVHCIISDRHQNYWVATNHGLYCLNSDFDILKIFDTDTGLSNEKIISIMPDQDDNIWVGTEFGLDLIQKSAGNFSVRNIAKGFRTSQIFVDRNDYLWICGNEEVYIENRNKIINKGSIFKNITNNAEAISSLKLRDEIWIGTRGSGIFKYSLSNDKMPELDKQQWIDPNNKSEINNTILSLFEDNYANIWVGTLDGLYLYVKSVKSPFHVIKNNPVDANTPSHNIISCIYRDEENNLWMATANGINKFTWGTDENSYHISRYYDNSSKAYQIRNNKIQTIIEYKKGIFLISTKSTVKFFDSEKYLFYENSHVNDTLAKYRMKYIQSSFKDKEGNLWLAFSEGGVGVLCATDGILYKVNFSRKANNRHRAIVRDLSGKVWVSSDDEGLYCLDIGEHPTQIRQITSYPKAQFNRSRITSIYIDKSLNIWVGTYNGLYKYDAVKDVFASYKLPLSRNNVYINNIIEDLYNNIWVTSLRGIFRISNKIEAQYYEPNSTKDFSKMGYISGLAIDKNGIIAIGGVNGLIYFNPTEVFPETYPHTPCISNFSIYNTEQDVDNKHLKKDVNLTDKIKLTHKDAQFSFEFSSLYYPNPMGIKYAYKLDGYDKDWIYTDAHRRYTSYSSLPPGKYTFMVKSTSVSGVWFNNAKELTVEILPAPWKTRWAYGIYIILLFCIIFLIYRIIQLNTKVKIEEKLNKWKISFYINLSYSLKTPLTLLYAPLNYLLKNGNHISENESTKLLQIINNNVKKLSLIISQMMEFRKNEIGKNSLNLQKTNIIQLTEELYKSFKWQAVSKHINFTFETDIPKLEVLVDPEKIEIILYNLLDNAFKFSANDGTISLKCELDYGEHRLWISVTDTGIGISEENMEKIFERFWRSESSIQNPIFAEQGIGLSLAKDYIEMHHGKIMVESKPGKGSTFKFYILLGHAHFSAKEQHELHPGEAKTLPVGINFEESTDHLTLPGISPVNIVETKPALCLLSSDLELFNFMKISLSDEFNILNFNNLEAFKKDIKKIMPNIIMIDISVFIQEDIYFQCRQFKENPATNPIPLILIAAVDSEEEKERFYEAGADAYITKPFSISYLKTRINQLLHTIDKFKDKIRKELITNPKESAIISNDDIFLANATKAVEENIANESFTIDNLAAKLKISRSMLYRKISLLTQESPVEFIKNIRLRKAAQLLEKTSYNITEISLMVGFPDPRYFSACFKKRFGITPKSYSLRNKGN